MLSRSFLVLKVNVYFAKWRMYIEEEGAINVEVRIFPEMRFIPAEILKL